MSIPARRRAVREPDPTQGEAALLSYARRTIRTAPPTWRWECPCQEPAVLLATYDTSGKINIKVRDRYWHLFGFGMVQAICPRCAAEHMLDLRSLREAIDSHPDDRVDGTS